MSLGIKCPYCNEPLEMESYTMPEHISSKMVIFCDNDQCEIKPCTDQMSPSRAFADVEAWR